LDWRVARLLAFENAIGIAGSAAPLIDDQIDIASIGQPQY
jgi:hypothetical protein